MQWEENNITNKLIVIKNIKILITSVGEGYF